jgi:hypothetical protein
VGVSTVGYLNGATSENTLLKATTTVEGILNVSAATTFYSSPLFTQGFTSSATSTFNGPSFFNGFATFASLPSMPLAYGALLVGGANNKATPLTSGTLNQILTVNASGTPEWMSGANLAGLTVTGTTTLQGAVNINTTGTSTTTIGNASSSIVLVAGTLTSATSSFATSTIGSLILGTTTLATTTDEVLMRDLVTGEVRALAASNFLLGATTHTATTSSNTLTSTVNGVVATTTVVTSNVLTSLANTLTSTVNGIASTAVNLINSFTQTLSGNMLTTTINGVTATSSVISSNTISLATSTGLLSSTINGVAATTSLGLIDGQILFGNTTNGLTQSSNLYWDSTNSRLGIGTSTPISKFTVNGEATFYQPGGNRFVITPGATSNDGVTLESRWDDSSAFNGWGPIILKNGFGEVAKFDVNSGLVLPTSVTLGGSSGAVLDYDSANTALTSNRSLIINSSHNPVLSLNGFTVQNTGLALQFDGDITATSYTNSSDARLKKDVATTTSNLTKLESLRPVDFRWISASSSQALQHGFIAQEVEAIMPELVITKQDGYKAVNYINLISILTGGVQELDKKLETGFTLVSQKDLAAWTNTGAITALTESVKNEAPRNALAYITKKCQQGTKRLPTLQLSASLQFKDTLKTFLQNRFILKKYVSEHREMKHVSQNKKLISCSSILLEILLEEQQLHRPVRHQKAHLLVPITLRQVQAALQRWSPHQERTTLLLNLPLQQKPHQHKKKIKLYSLI